MHFPSSDGNSANPANFVSPRLEKIETLFEQIS
jgi:hypothetical protein